VKAASASSVQAATYRNAAVGEASVHRAPAIALAARLPRLWTVASSPKAEPLSASGTRWATAACSAVSTPPTPRPARMKPIARMGRLAAVMARSR